MLHCIQLWCEDVRTQEVSKAAELQGIGHGWLGMVASDSEIRLPGFSIAVGTGLWCWRDMVRSS